MSAALAAVTRKRKLLHLSLSDAARERLREMSGRTGKPMARIIDDLVMAAEMPSQTA